MYVLEVGCIFDRNLEEELLTKTAKYQALVDGVWQIHYECRILVFILGSLITEGFVGVADA